MYKDESINKGLSYLIKVNKCMKMNRLIKVYLILSKMSRCTVCVCVCVCVSCETRTVLEAGHTDGEQLHQPVELGEGHVGRPALDQGLVGVLHDPQETHQQVPAGL